MYCLKNAKWIPQKKAKSKTFFVQPCDASVKFLPKGFSYETGQKWLDAIEFGKKAEENSLRNKRKKAEQRERNQRAKELGFDSSGDAENAAEIFNLLKKQGKSPESLLEKKQISGTTDGKAHYKSQSCQRKRI